MIYELFIVLCAWVSFLEGLVRIGSLFSLLSPPCLGVWGTGFLSGPLRRGWRVKPALSMLLNVFPGLRSLLL